MKSEYLLKHRKGKKMNVKLSRADWEVKHIQDLKALTKKNSKNQALLDVLANESASAFQKNTVKHILDSAYKKYCIEFDFAKTKTKEDEHYSKLIVAIRDAQKKTVVQSRKERTHELIMIGALTEVTKFEKDRGLVAGVLLDALDRMNENEQVKWDLKKRGDELLHAIEIENKAKKEKRKNDGGK